MTIIRKNRMLNKSVIPLYQVCLVKKNPFKLSYVDKLCACLVFPLQKWSVICMSFNEIKVASDIDFDISIGLAAFFA